MSPSAVQRPETRVTTYLRMKEAEARTAAEAEARRLALEAEARIAEANESNTDESAIEAAVESMDAASKADESGQRTRPRTDPHARCRRGAHGAQG